ncbi:MAG: DUF3806 domain-containing protein [Chloroflexota bacterium]
MKQIIKAPNEEWINYLAQMWLFGNEISQDILNKEMDGSLGDLQKIQDILDTKQVDSEATQVLEALGVIFGKVFVNETPHYDWWIVEDEHGIDACVRYKETSLISFPQEMIVRRVEDNEEFNVPELYEQLGNELAEIQEKHFQNT